MSEQAEPEAGAKPRPRVAGAWLLTDALGSWVRAALLSVGVVVGLITLTEAGNRKLHPIPATCPSCGEELAKGGARFDGCVPTGQDVVILAGFACVVAAVRYLAAS